MPKMANQFGFGESIFSPENQKEKKTIGCNFLMALVNQLMGGGGGVNNVVAVVEFLLCSYSWGLFFFFLLCYCWKCVLAC
jgi:hypothetical protein